MTVGNQRMIKWIRERIKVGKNGRLRFSQKLKDSSILVRESGIQR